jgi:fimbrial isopeptide formation D2 family protein
VGVLNSQADIKFNLSSSMFNDFNGWYLDIRAENGQKIHTDFKINNSAESEELSLPSAERNYTALIKNQNKTAFAEVEINAEEIADGDLTIKSADIDPEGIVYDSFTREALAGVRLYLLDEAGNRVDAELLETGQQGQLTDESGSYQFIVKEEGKYQIAVEKDGYAKTPSLELAPKSDSYIRPEEITDADSSDPDIQVVDYSRAPEKNEEAVYYLKFDLQSGDPDVLNNHLPIDPLQENLLEISKTAAEKQTAVGEFISYQITVENDGENDVKDFELHDKLPNLFKYTADSAIIERGKTKELFEAGGERLLSWDISELKAGESFKLSYTLVVGSGAQSGIEYTNQAYLKKGNTIISDTAEAKVLVTKDAVLDLSTLIGKVYFDQNENGIQDKGEKGIVGVEIISITGERIAADDQGRFHLVTAADSMTAVGETIVLKLKEDTLPDGAEVISDNPLIIKVRPGLMRKANFRIKLKE